MVDTIRSASHPLSQAQALQNTAPSIFARISTRERCPFFDLLDHFTEPSSHFIAPAAILKEAVYDLDWTQAEAVLQMRRDPQSLYLRSSNNRVSLDIELPVEELTTFSCAVPLLKWEYRRRHLRTIFAHVGAGRGDRRLHMQDVTTKVSVDAHGLMRVGLRCLFDFWNLERRLLGVVPVSHCQVLPPSHESRRDIHAVLLNP